MQKHRLRLKSLLILTTLLGGLAGFGLQAQAPIDPGAPEGYEISREDRVRELYAEAARNLQAAGHDLSLEVKNFATIFREDFGQYKTYEVFSLGEGARLYIEPHTHGANVEMPDGSHREIDRFITFHLKWQPDYWQLNTSPKRAELFQSLRTQPFADYMKAAAQEDESLAVVEAVTSFEVHLDFEDRQRVYRSMVAWFPEGSAERAYALVDEVVLQLATTLEPDLPVRPEAALEKTVEIPEALQTEIAESQGGNDSP